MLASFSIYNLSSLVYFNKYLIVLNSKYDLTFKVENFRKPELIKKLLHQCPEMLKNGMI